MMTGIGNFISSYLICVFRLRDRREGGLVRYSVSSLLLGFTLFSSFARFFSYFTHHGHSVHIHKHHPVTHLRNSFILLDYDCIYMPVLLRGRRLDSILASLRRFDVGRL